MCDSMDKMFSREKGVLEPELHFETGDLCQEKKDSACTRLYSEHPLPNCTITSVSDRISLLLSQASGQAVMNYIAEANTDMHRVGIIIVLTVLKRLSRPAVNLLNRSKVTGTAVVVRRVFTVSPRALNQLIGAWVFTSVFQLLTPRVQWIFDCSLVIFLEVFHHS